MPFGAMHSTREDRRLGPKEEVAVDFHTAKAEEKTQDKTERNFIYWGKTMGWEWRIR